jgi:hypothetical protein
VLYIGAGVQQSIGLPGWHDLLARLTIKTLVDSTAYRNEKDRYRTSFSSKHLGRDTTEIRKAVISYNRPLLMMARAIKSRMRSVVRSSIADTLYWSGAPAEYLFFEVIEGSARGRKPKDYPHIPSSELIRSLVSIAHPREGWAGVKAVVNYNYDDWLDLKIREAGIKSVTVISGEKGYGQDELPCYHVHGVLPFWQYARNSGKFNSGNFLFSEDEYHDEYSNPYKWSNIVQTSLLSSLGGLFVGLSLEDPNIRRLVDTTHRQFPRIKHYAVLKRGRSLKARGRSRADTVANLFEEVESNVFAEMGILILWVDEHEQIPEIIRYVGGLEKPRMKKLGREVWDQFPVQMRNDGAG